MMVGNRTPHHWVGRSPAAMNVCVDHQPLGRLWCFGHSRRAPEPRSVFPMTRLSGITVGPRHLATTGCHPGLGARGAAGTCTS